MGQDASTSSFSGSECVFSYGRKKCEHCGWKHPSDQCKKSSGACFQCGEMGHLKRDCPQLRGRSGSRSGSQTRVQQQSQQGQGQSIGGSSLRPHAQGQVFVLNQDQAAEETERVIASTFILCGIPALVLIDTVHRIHSYLQDSLSVIVYPLFP